MSLESAKAFLEKMKTDEVFREKIGKLEDKTERGKLVEAEGFDFTKEEIMKVKGELTEEDLEKLDGAGICWSDSFSCHLANLDHTL